MKRQHVNGLGEPSSLYSIGQQRKDPYYIPIKWDFHGPYWWSTIIAALALAIGVVCALLTK